MEGLAIFGILPSRTSYTIEMVHDLYKGLFDVVSPTQTHIFQYVIKKYVNYEYDSQWFKAMRREMFAALERRLGWHVLIAGRPV
jgi:hypothetical protein